jgi:hypothetical protein
MQPQTMNAMKTDREQLRLAFFLTPWPLFPNYASAFSDATPVMSAWG